jgi:subfamily B ATP-binding cassette protein MsbA
MSSQQSKKDSKKGRPGDFLKALTYLWPHRRLVIISTLCAIVCAVASITGLSTMAPILQVFFKGDTVQAWVDREVACYRLGAKLENDPHSVMMVATKSYLGEKGPAEKAHVVTPAVVERIAEISPIPKASTDDAGQYAIKNSVAMLRYLADSKNSLATLTLSNGQVVTLPLKNVTWYMEAGEKVGAILPTTPVKSIAAVFGIIAALALISNVFIFFQEYLAERAAILAVNDVRRQLYDHILHMPVGYFSLKGTSDATSRLVQDANGLLEGYKAVLGDAILEPIRASFMFGVALVLSWRLTIFIVIFAPFMAVLIHKFGKKMRRANRRALEKSSAALSQLEGTLIGIRVVKAATAERFERRRYSTILWQLVQQNLRMSRIDAASSPIMESLMFLMCGAIILYAAYLVFDVPPPHNLEVNTLIMVMVCLAFMSDSLRKVTKVNNSLQKANAAVTRIFEVLEVPIERRRGLRHAIAAIRPDEQTVRLLPISREIRFENVSFTYANAGQPALSDVSLTVAKGTSIAIVGRNGSGKTTLLAMLPRFYDPGSGRIVIDGIDIRQATLRSLRNQIGIVTQDSVIFPGTIEQNIAYGFAKPDRPRVLEAAQRAFAHDFIMEKGGYETVLGEHGQQLSGGQKQRLCIARAIYRASPILILDEATSQVDAESEHLIQQAIEQVMHERTTFVIAHRFSTILSADTIVVMERGQIVGQGKHDELLKTCPIYRQLYERQLFFGGESAA